MVLSDGSVASQDILRALQVRLPNVRVVTDVQEERRGSGPYIAVGPLALRSLLASDVAAPILSTFVSNEAYQKVRSLAKPDRRVTAIYAEASPAQQFRLVRGLYKRRVQVLVALSEATHHLHVMLEQAARQADLELLVVTVTPEENVVRAVARQRNATALVVVPDPDLFTPDVLRNLLEAAYRRGQAVVGFSEAWVHAGLLGATFSTIPDVVAQVPSVIEDLVQGRTPQPQYPRYWRSAINEQVARSLNIVVDDAARQLGNPAPSA